MQDNMTRSFSKRNNFASTEAEIIIREDAPKFLRFFVIRQAIKEGVPRGSLLEIVCDVLHQAPEGNWGANYIERELYAHINSCEWFKIYDIAEAIYSFLEKNNINNGHVAYAKAFNEFCYEKGIGWNFKNGCILTRATEIEENISKLLFDNFSESSYPTAKNELREALNDISRRPKPDLTGGVQHAVAALECVARKITNEKCTLGDIIKRHRALFPTPLDVAVEKIWGYASEKGRHLRESNEPSFREVLLIIGLSSSLIAFLNIIPGQNESADIDIPF